MLILFLGITPAYAGKRRNENFSINGDQDHPRLCGEKSGTMRGGLTGIGSPPPMRGKGSRFWCGFLRRWITPAYAGKRYDPDNEFDEEYGSPPPMRGKVIDRIFPSES